MLLLYNCSRIGWRSILSAEQHYKHIFIIGSDAEEDFQLIRNKFQDVYGIGGT